MIFGKTKLHWAEWKKQWDEQFYEWTVQAMSFVDKTPSFVSPKDENTRTKFDNDRSMLERLAFVQKRRQISDMFASKFSLLNLSKTNGVERSLNQARNRRRVARRAEEQYYQRCASIRSLYEHSEANTSTSRKKHHVKNLADVSKLQTDMSIARRRLRSNRMATVDLSAVVRTMLVADDKKTTKRFDHESSKPCNTARERRRECLKNNLE